MGWTAISRASNDLRTAVLSGASDEEVITCLRSFDPYPALVYLLLVNGVERRRFLPDLVRAALQLRTETMELGLEAVASFSREGLDDDIAPIFRSLDLDPDDYVFDAVATLVAYVGLPKSLAVAREAAESLPEGPTKDYTLEILNQIEF